MRKKKHLEEKLSTLTNLIDIPPVTEDYRTYVIKKEYFDYNKLFIAHLNAKDNKKLTIPYGRTYNVFN